MENPNQSDKKKKSPSTTNVQSRGSGGAQGGGIGLPKFNYVPGLYTTNEGNKKSLKTIAEELGYIK